MSKLEVTIIAWFLLQLPLASLMGRVLKQSSFTDGSKHPIGETATLSTLSPSLLGAESRRLPSNIKSTLAPATGVDSATDLNFADHSDAVAGQYHGRLA